MPGNIIQMLCDVCAEYTKNSTTAALNSDLLEVEGTLQKMPLMLLSKHIIIQIMLMCVQTLSVVADRLARCCYYHRLGSPKLNLLW